MSDAGKEFGEYWQTQENTREMKNILEGVSDDSRYCMEKLRLSLNPQERPDKVSERSVHSYSADLGDGILRNRCE